MRLRCAGALLFALTGCAFFGKSAPLQPEYYSAAQGSRVPAKQDSAARAEAPSLRLGRVTSSAHLRERIAYRPSERELGFYEERRWSERPEAYFQRALAEALFEQRGLVRATSGPAPSLEAELTDFEELLAPRHAVRVRARVLLADGQRARFEHSFAVEQAVASGDDFAPVAEAMATALARCVAEIGDRVVAELAAARPLDQPEPGAAPEPSGAPPVPPAR